MRKYLFPLMLCCTIVLHAQKTIIYCGKMVDVKSLKVLTEMSIVVDSGRITDVQKGYIPSNSTDKIIDLKSKTVMPGLIDCHVHLEDETKPNAMLDKFRLN